MAIFCGPVGLSLSSKLSETAVGGHTKILIHSLICKHMREFQGEGGNNVNRLDMKPDEWWPVSPPWEICLMTLSCALILRLRFVFPSKGSYIFGINPEKHNQNEK